MLAKDVKVLSTGVLFGKVGHRHILIRLRDVLPGLGECRPYNDDVGMGLYISVPFCRTKCSFCNFASDVFSKSAYENYVVCVLQEIGLIALALPLRLRGDLPEDRGFHLPGWRDAIDPRRLTVGANLRGGAQ